MCWHDDDKSKSIRLGHFVRNSKTQQDFFVGGRSVSGFAAGISLLATLLSSNSYLAYPAEVIAFGTGVLWQILSYPIVFIVVGYFFIPQIMSVPVSSAYELLESRLGSSIRTLAACLFIFVRLNWMALVLYSVSMAMSEIVGIGPGWLMLGLWFVTVIYTTEGGIRAVIWTDIAQFFILLGGAIFTVVYLMVQEQIGLNWLIEEGWNSSRQTPLFSFDLSARTAFGWTVQTGVWWIASCGSDQIAMQRFFTNRNAAVARRTLAVNLIASALSLIPLASIGLVLLHFYSSNPGQTSPLKVFPHFITNEMPSGLSGLVVAALLAAAMSSLSSGFNSLTTVLTVDFFQRRSPGGSEQKSESVGRRHVQLTTIAIGMLTLAIGFPLTYTKVDLFEVTSRMMDPITGPMFGLFAMAFFDRRATGQSAWIGFITGTVTAYCLAYGHLALGIEEGISFLWILPASIAVTIVVGMFASRTFVGWRRPLLDVRSEASCPRRY